MLFQSKRSGTKAPWYLYKRSGLSTIRFIHRVRINSMSEFALERIIVEICWGVTLRDEARRIRLF